MITLLRHKCIPRPWIGLHHQSRDDTFQCGIYSGITLYSCLSQEHMELEKRYRELTDLLVMQMPYNPFTQFYYYLIFMLWFPVSVSIYDSVLQANSVRSHG